MPSSPKGVAETSPHLDGDFAAAVLTYLGADADRFERFLAITGLGVAELRAASGTPGFAESLLDYVSSDEKLLVGFAAESGYDLGALVRLREARAGSPAHDP